MRRIWPSTFCSALGVAAELLCVAGVLVMRTTLDRLHYAAAATTVPAFLVLVAVLVRVHMSAGGLQAIATVGLLFLAQPRAGDRDGAGGAARRRPEDA